MSAVDLVLDFLLASSFEGIIACEEAAVVMLRFALTQRCARLRGAVVRARGLRQAAADNRLLMWQERAFAAERGRGNSQQLLCIIRELDLYRDVLVTLVSRHPELAGEVRALRSELRGVESDEEQ